MRAFAKVGLVFVWVLISPVLVVITARAQALERFRIDPASTRMTLDVGKAGLFAFAGHEHEVAVPAMKGDIVVDRSDLRRSSLRIEFDAAALRVTGKGEPPEDVPEVQRVMLSERVLDVQRYPTIVFESRSITVFEGGADQEASRATSSDALRLRVIGDLTLHGTTRPVTVPVTLRLSADSLTADGRARVKQTDFGIRPVTAGAGTVRVKDEVDVLFSVTARLR